MFKLVSAFQFMITMQLTNSNIQLKYPLLTKTKEIVDEKIYADEENNGDIINDK